MIMGDDGVPATGTCDLTTVGRRTGKRHRTEIWYVIVDGHLVLTGTPGPREWLANLRAHPEAVLHLRVPLLDLAVMAAEVKEPGQRRRLTEEAWRLQPWYAARPYSTKDWIASSPMVILRQTPLVLPLREDAERGHLG